MIKMHRRRFLTVSGSTAAGAAIGRFATGKDAAFQPQLNQLPGGRDFETGSGTKADFSQKTVDSRPGILRFLPAMALNSIHLPPDLRRERSRRDEKETPAVN